MDLFDRRHKSRKFKFLIKVIFNLKKIIFIAQGILLHFLCYLASKSSSGLIRLDKIDKLFPIISQWNTIRHKIKYCLECISFEIYN